MSDELDPRVVSGGVLEIEIEVVSEGDGRDCCGDGAEEAAIALRDGEALLMVMTRGDEFDKTEEVGVVVSVDELALWLPLSLASEAVEYEIALAVV
jgi:hypothetical protein